MLLTRLPVKLPNTPVKLPSKLVRLRPARAGSRIGLRIGFKRPPKRPPVAGLEVAPVLGLVSWLGAGLGNKVGLLLKEGYN